MGAVTHACRKHTEDLRANARHDAERDEELLLRDGRGLEDRGNEQGECSNSGSSLAKASIPMRRSCPMVLRRFTDTIPLPKSWPRRIHRAMRDTIAIAKSSTLDGNFQS